MSSTKANSTKRIPNDYYVTPVDEIDKFLSSHGKSFVKGEILDPAAGGDITTDMSYPLALARFGYSCDTLDIRSDSRATLIADYLKYDCKGQYDTIITNPPFSRALEFIEKGLDDVKAGGHVIYLLRLNFLGSEKRNPFLMKQMPKAIVAHSRRMSFTNDGHTDSIEYAHFIWSKEPSEKPTELYLLPY